MKIFINSKYKDKILNVTDYLVENYPQYSTVIFTNVSDTEVFPESGENLTNEQIQSIIQSIDNVLES